MKEIYSRLDEAVYKKDSNLACCLVQAELTNPNNSYAEALGALKYIEEKFPQAVVAYDTFPREINPNQEAWTDDYFYEQSNCLSYNFSRKRFEHLVEVAKYLEQQGHELFQKKTKQRASSPVASTGSAQSTQEHQAPPSQSPSEKGKQTLPLTWLFLGIAILLALLIVVVCEPQSTADFMMNKDK